MKKIILSFLFFIFPALLYADNPLSFSPPASDASVVFLSNLFGMVDGVLRGGGSQILGTMFGVFNAAVLALGGIIIMYTLIVSTLNTAHEGNVLGQKWSSMWVPVRSTFGLALLIPKASGYCIMQILVMWVVLQGVGAADKVWNAALGYLNRGGVIVQTQIDPVKLFTGQGANIATGASKILSGQVCMLGLQKALTNLRNGYLNSQANKAGRCYLEKDNPDFQKFCTTPVPDFIGSVNIITASDFSVKMPNFSTGPYSTLTGICGEIKWAGLEIDDKKKLDALKNFGASIETAKISRAIAIQQLYQDLSRVANTMVDNDPQFKPIQIKPIQTLPALSIFFSPVAERQYGIPYRLSGTVCKKTSVTPLDDPCSSWGSDPSITLPPIFSGIEFQGALANYNTIMKPTLTLLAEIQSSTDPDKANKQRAFIRKSSSEGWILAGSYFFNLALLNDVGAAVGGDLVDSKSGLENTVFTLDNFKEWIDDNCKTTFCQWFPTKADAEKSLQKITSLINGDKILPSAIPQPIFSGDSKELVTGKGSSTVYGFIKNATLIDLPEQPGLKAPKITLKFPEIKSPNFDLPQPEFDCGQVRILFFKFCLGRLLAQVFYFSIFKTILIFAIKILLVIANIVLNAFLAVPLTGIAEIFRQSLAYIQQPSVNPIVALAGMGTNYINFATNLWLLLTSLAAVFGTAVMGMLVMFLPLLLAWLGTMTAIGFVTAYYIPFLPYMLFTFGALGWLIMVIEAMVAAPIVALGVTHPEGEGLFGKGERAIMILMNVFLRPSMMIIGYIAGIALSYVGIWIINAGFSNVSAFILGTSGAGVDGSWRNAFGGGGKQPGDEFDPAGGYESWAATYGFFFCVLIYTSMYLTVVQKAFTLITVLPDKVLRWIGGEHETIGQETAQWVEDTKQKVSDAGKSTQDAAQAATQAIAARANKKKKKTGREEGEVS